MVGNLATYLTFATLALSASQAAGSEDKLKDLMKSSGFVEIKLVEAHVPDLDPLPMQRDSDVFVRVYLNDTKELVCESQIVQDDNKPKVSIERERESGLVLLLAFSALDP